MRNENKLEVKRGDILFVDLNGGVRGSEQGGMRPVVVLQNDIGNKYSPCIIVAMITSKLTKRPLPTHITLHKGESGLIKDSVVLLEQIRTIDKSRIDKKISTLPSYKMEEINNAMLISLGLGEMVVA